MNSRKRGVMSRSELFENTLAMYIFLTCFIFLVAPPDDQICSSLAMHSDTIILANYFIYVFLDLDHRVWYR